MNANPSTTTAHGGSREAAAELSPLDVPVTLTVELGRVNLSLNRLADLKPGDVIELGRHSREPVELTSNGRLVARGELILIDTELGVRVTHVFL
jgi:flagellar motor switch protein FliN/FliY